jgi:two-component system phosphate regulon response regulator PhoB
LAEQPAATSEPTADHQPAPAALTRTEARLFEVLRRQPGRAFTRRELVTFVMPRSIVLERTIDVHVKSLRRKLGDGGQQIQTVRRVGYRYVPAGA